MAAPKMCLINIRGAKFVLPVGDALKVFEALCGAQEVRYDWSAKAHRPVTPDEDGPVSMQAFSAVQLAQLAMEDPTT